MEEWSMKQQLLPPEELNDFLKLLGSQIRQARKKMSLSQAKASEAIGIDYRHYQNIEGGKINLRLDTLLKLFKFYNLSGPSNQAQLGTLTSLVSGGQGEPAQSSDSKWFRNILKRPHTPALSINITRGCVHAANLALAQLVGLTSPDEVIGLKVERVLRSSDWELALKAMRETLPPHQPQAHALHILHQALPSLQKVLAVPHLEAAPGGESIITMVLLSREDLLDIKTDIDVFQKSLCDAFNHSFANDNWPVQRAL